MGFYTAWADSRRSARLSVLGCCLEAKSIEIGRRADDLRQALDQTHAVQASIDSEKTALLRRQVEEIATLRSELECVRQKADADAANTHAALIAAVEEATSFKGKLDGISKANLDVATQGPSGNQRHGFDKQKGFSS